MLRQKRTKFSRMRGSMTHGGGHKKKRRGKGHRGGVGMSGTGARGDAQKAGLMAKSSGILKKYSASHGVKLKDVMKNLTNSTYFGKRGFHSIQKTINKTISLRDVEINFDKMVEEGLIVKEGKEFVFDAKLAGIDKVLGKTEFTKKVKVICKFISASAKQKIIDAGGSVESEDNDEFDSNESGSKDSK